MSKEFSNLEYLQRFVDGEVSPEEFELELFSGESGLRELLDKAPPITSRSRWSAFLQLIDVHITHNPKGAVSVVETFLRENCGERVTDKQVKKIEKKLGLSLPPSYIRYLSSLPLRDEPENEVVVLGTVPDTLKYHLGDGSVFLDFLPLSELASYQKEWSLRKTLVPFSGDGHTFLCLDYSAPNEPSVIFVETDDFEEYPIADSFEHFLQLIRIGQYDDDDDAPEELADDANT